MGSGINKVGSRVSSPISEVTASPAHIDTGDVRAAHVPTAGGGASVYSLVGRRQSSPTSATSATSAIARLFAEPVSRMDPVGMAKATAVGEAFLAMLFPRNGQSGPQGSENV